MKEKTTMYEQGDIIALYAERLALHTGKSKACNLFFSKYASEHESVVRNYIKQICDEKYPLQFILNLLEPQVFQTVKNMAVILHAGYESDKAFFEQLEKTYRANSKKENLLPIEDAALQKVHRSVCETGDVSLGIRAFQSKALNVVSRAFYWVYIVCRDGQYTEEQCRRLAESAIFAIELPRKKEISPNALNHIERFQYLNDNIAKPYFKPKSMGAIYRRDLRNYMARFNGTDLSRDYCVELAFMIMIFSMNHSGIIQDGRFDAMVLTKEEILRLAVSAYYSSGLDEIKENIEDVWIHNNGSAEMREKAEKAKRIFEISMVSLVYESFLCETIKKLFLTNIERYFFSPEGDTLHKELTAARKKIERTEKEFEKCEQKLKTAEKKVMVADNTAAEARNKVAGLQSKIEKKQTEIDALKDKLAQAEKEIAESRTKEPEQEPQKETADTSDSDREAVDYAAVLDEIFAQKTIVFVGGNPNIMQKFRLKYPNAIIIPQNRIPTSEQQFASADIIMFKTDSMAHKDYLFVKSIAERRDIPYGYISDVTNLALLEKDVAEKLTKLLAPVG